MSMEVSDAGHKGLWRAQVMTHFIYGMKLRGFSPWAQPDEGLLGKVEDFDKYYGNMYDRDYYDYLIYDRVLEIDEEVTYDLDLVGKVTVYAEG